MSTNYLERTARTYKRNVKEGAHKLHEGVEKVDIFKDYKDSKDQKQEFVVMFEYADEEGNLTLVDKNMVRVVLTAEDFKKENSYYSKKIKERFIGLDISVIVSDIDEQSKTVYVVPAVTKDQQKSALMKEIFSALKKGNHPRLAGDVMSVQTNRITVNILHKNILGIMNIKDWSPIYTRHFNAVVKPGDVVEFEVVRQAPKKPGADIAFELSRREIAANPWDEIPEFKKGDVITVKCIDKPKGKNIDRTYWWGISSLAPGIEIMCDINPRLQLYEGASYKCRVRNFDREKRIFQCVAFEVSHAGVVSKSNVRFLNGKAKHSPKQ